MIAATTFLAFAPSLGHEFVDWDDDKLLVHNSRFRGLGSSQLRWMFSTQLMGHYQPFTWLTYGLDHVVWGMNPRGYHLTNVILHVANALLFYYVARRLLRLAGRWAAPHDTWAAAIAAWFFAMHPLRVESVAWVTERRDVLSGLFFLVAIWSYLRVHAPGASRVAWHAVSLAAFAACLLSKATAVGLPLVLLVLDWYPLRRWSGLEPRWRLLIEKGPYVLLALGAAVLAWRAESQAETVADLSAHGVDRRLLQAAFGISFYLVKTIWPFGLTPLVPMPTSFSSGVFVGSVAAVAAGSVLLFVQRARWPAVLAVATSYVVLLLPVLGLVQIGPQLVADRYSYMPALGLSLLVGAAVAAVRIRMAGAVVVWRGGFDGVLLLLLAGLCVLTVRQVGVWRDSVSLYGRMVRGAPESSIAHLGLAMAVAERGEPESSLPHFRRAIELRPSFARAHYGLGVALLALDRLHESERSFETAVELRPEDGRAWSNLGAVRLRRGDGSGAGEALQRAVECSPDDPLPWYNLGLVQAQRGALDVAIGHWRRAVAAAPQSVAALEILAWHLATAADDSLRDGAAAVELAERACRLTGNEDPSCLDVMAAAYAERGEFDRAERTAERAAALARRRGLEQLERDIVQRLALYRTRRPVRGDAAAAPR